MRKLTTIIYSACIAAACASAGEVVMWTVTTGTNAAAAVTKQANPFIGEVDSIAVSTAVGVTGAVAVVATDPYTGNALVLATNAAVTGYMVWTPRMAEADVGGSTARLVTNSPSADCFRAVGERFSASVADASATGAVFRVRIAVK